MTVSLYQPEALTSVFRICSLTARQAKFLTFFFSRVLKGESLIRLMFKPSPLLISS